MRATNLLAGGNTAAVKLPAATSSRFAANQGRALRPKNIPATWRVLPGALLIFLAYYVGSKFGFLLTFRPHPVSVLWPPNSILLAALLLAPVRSWWVVLLAALPAHWLTQWQSDIPPSMALCYYVSNCSEALIGAGLTRYFVRGSVRFDDLHNVALFCLCGGFLGPFLSSFLDGAFVIANGWGTGTFWEIFRLRLFSNVLTALTLAPAIVTWFTPVNPEREGTERGNFVEGALLFAGLIAICLAALRYQTLFRDPVLFYMLLPFLLWAAVRFGSRGETAGVLIVTFLTIWGAARGPGAFLKAGLPEENALHVQLFLIFMSAPLLFLAALIEERNRAGVKLRESDALNRGVLDSLTSMIAILDRSARIIATNASWQRAGELAGGSNTAIGVGVNYLQVCRDAARAGNASVENAITGIEAVLHGAQNEFHCEYECSGPAGALWFEMLVLPLQTKAGGVVIKHRDITLHKRIEKALRDHDARIALAAETANLALWTIDYEQGESWMSENGRRLYGLEPNEPLSRELFLSRVHPDDRAAVDDVIERARQNAGTFEIEYRLLRTDGETRWLIARGRYLKNDRGELSELLGAAIDVTGQKRSEQLFQLAAEASHLGLWDWDETAGELSWDGATRDIFDIPPEEKVTLDLFYSRIHPHDCERVKQTWRGAFESGLPFQLEYRIRRRDESIRWVDARGRGYYDNKGNTVRMIGIVIDVTAQTNANLELRRQREEMARLNRVTAMGELTASLAHELNQPLAAIGSNAAAGRRFLAHDSANRELLDELLADVVADAHRAGEIIHGIHRFIRKEEGSRQVVDLNEVIREVLRLLHSDLIGRAVIVERQLSLNPAHVQADPIQMQQVLLNLTMNSLEATQEVAAAKRVIRIATGTSGGVVTVSIRDHGLGLPEDPERIFDKYFTTKRNGMGMGLTIVRSIVEAHDGEVTAENTGDGACFSFRLPSAYASSQKEVA